MIIKTGVDLVYLPRFKKATKFGGENFMQRVFNEQELTQGKTNIQHLAGIFAAKEAVIKALSMPTDSWHDIRITHDSDGAPKVLILRRPITSSSLSLRAEGLISHSLSISHDTNYIIAQFVAILK